MKTFIFIHHGDLDLKCLKITGIEVEDLFNFSQTFVFVFSCADSLNMYCSLTGIGIYIFNSSGRKATENLVY